MTLAGTSALAQTLTTPEGTVGDNTSTDQVLITGYTLMTNPNGRTLMLQRNDGDSWLTFHDPDNAWFSMGIDYSNSRNFVINTGSDPGSASQFIMNYEGKIGLSANPRGTLDVSTDISNGKLGTVLGRLPEGNNIGDGTYLGVRGYNTQSNLYQGKSFSLEHSFYGNVNSSINFFRGPDVAGGYLTFNTNNNAESMRITRDGNVGIGTTAPDQKLTVKGYIHAQEIRVDLNVPGPDYVFEKNYNLLPLADLERYINENKHLPEVPAAPEMMANGVYLKEMNMLLLKKVEELTLHIIEQQKTINSLTNRVVELEKK